MTPEQQFDELRQIDLRDGERIELAKQREEFFAYQAQCRANQRKLDADAEKAEHEATKAKHEATKTEHEANEKKAHVRHLNFELAQRIVLLPLAVALGIGVLITALSNPDEAAVVVGGVSGWAALAALLYRLRPGAGKGQG